MGTFDFALAPDEGGGGLVVGGDERLNGFNPFFGTAKACAAEGFPGEDAKPDFDLVEPTCRRRCEVEVDIGVRGQPVMILLVCAVVIEDHMNRLIVRNVGDPFFHERLEIWAFLGLGGLRLDLTWGDIERGEQIDRAMPFVGALHAPYNFAAAGAYVPGLSFQRLNRRLLVDADHEGVLRRTEIQADNIRCLCRELWIRAHAPRTMPPKLDAFLAQDTPNRIIRHAERLRQCPAVPANQPALPAAEFQVA